MTACGWSLRYSGYSGLWPRRRGRAYVIPWRRSRWQCDVGKLRHIAKSGERADASGRGTDSIEQPVIAGVQGEADRGLGSPYRFFELPVDYPRAAFGSVALWRAGGSACGRGLAAGGWAAVIADGAIEFRRTADRATSSPDETASGAGMVLSVPGHRSEE